MRATTAPTRGVRSFPFFPIVPSLCSFPSSTNAPSSQSLLPSTGFLSFPVVLSFLRFHRLPKRLPSQISFTPHCAFRSTSHMDTQLTLPAYSLPLIPPPLRLHVRSLHRHYPLLPPQRRALRLRTTHGPTPRHCLLVPRAIVPRARVR